jgi:hypothetical protein
MSFSVANLTSCVQVGCSDGECGLDWCEIRQAHATLKQDASGRNTQFKLIGESGVAVIVLRTAAAQLWLSRCRKSQKTSLPTIKFSVHAYRITFLRIAQNDRSPSQRCGGGGRGRRSAGREVRVKHAGQAQRRFRTADAIFHSVKLQTIRRSGPLEMRAPKVADKFVEVCERMCEVDAS